MKLEDFIQQHRGEFEEEGPGPGVWAALEKELPVKAEAQGDLHDGPPLVESCHPGCTCGKCGHPPHFPAN